MNIACIRALNPFQYPLTCKTGSIATLFFALATIGALAAFFALLASQGVHLGAFNSFSQLGTPTSVVFLIITGGINLLILVWLIVAISGCCKKESLENYENFSVDSSEYRGVGPRNHVAIPSQQNNAFQGPVIIPITTQQGKQQVSLPILIPSSSSESEEEDESGQGASSGTTTTPFFTDRFLQNADPLLAQELLYSLPQPLPDVSHLPQSPLDVYYRDAVASKGEEVKINEQKVRELIAVVHAITTIDELKKFVLEEAKDTRFNLFVQVVLACRRTRILLDEAGTEFDPKIDIVIPVCNEGKNRSAVIYGILRLIYPELTILHPHGAVGGFDPGERPLWAGVAGYVDEKQPHEAVKLNGYRNCLGIERPRPFGIEKAEDLELDLNSQEWRHYYAGVKASESFGERPAPADYNQANVGANDKKVAQLKEWNNKNLFGLQEQLPEKRVIFLTLTDPANTEIKKRLADNNSKAHVLTCGPFPDELNTAKDLNAANRSIFKLSWDFMSDLLQNPFEI